MPSHILLSLFPIDVLSWIVLSCRQWMKGGNNNNSLKINYKKKHTYKITSTLVNALHCNPEHFTLMSLSLSHSVASSLLHEFNRPKTSGQRPSFKIWEIYYFTKGIRWGMVRGCGLGYSCRIIRTTFEIIILGNVYAFCFFFFF